jgi:prepilin-type processing-associated H-X9-DG protein
LHSWRTLILPYIEQQALYSQIDLNEPWDSPKNSAYNNVVIPTFHCQSHPPGPGCDYVAIVGPNTAFQGDKPVGFMHIIDGTSNTIAIVEAKGNSVSWMAPVDFDITKMQFKPNSGANDPSSFHPGGVNVLFCDGSVRFVSNNTDPRVFQAMSTINDGQVIPQF